MLADISYSGLLLSLLLLLPPLVVVGWIGRRPLLSVVVALLRMAGQLALTALYLHYLFRLDNAWVNIAWLLVMAAVAAATTLRQARLSLRALMPATIAGLASTALVLGLYAVLVVVRPEPLLSTQAMVPLMGLMLGSMVFTGQEGLKAYHDAMASGRETYHYLLGNGASHFEAITPFLRKALSQALAPITAGMAMAGIVGLSPSLAGMLLAGAEPLVAVGYEIVICIMCFSSSLMSVAITIYVADRNR